MTRIIFFFFLSIALHAQPNSNDEKQLKTFFDTSLLNGHAYQWLDYLTNRISSRLTGSLGGERALTWTHSELGALGRESDYLQPV